MFDDAAERRYVVAKTSVERIARIAGTTRAKAGDLCMLLDVIGVATFKQAKQTGDYKFPTRIHWRYVPRSHWPRCEGRRANGRTALSSTDSPCARVATLRLPIDRKRCSTALGVLSWFRPDSLLSGAKASIRRCGSAAIR